MTSGYHPGSTESRSLRGLLHLRGQERLFAGALLVGLLLGWWSTTRLNLPLWGATVVALGLLAYPATRKWRADRRKLGTPIMVLGVLLSAQVLHTVEHLAQWTQYHLLGWPIKSAGGFISPLNSEVVHFIWNTGVLLVVVYLLAAGLRNRWMWLLLLWASAHTAEHIYLFVNYLGALQYLLGAGLPTGAAQGLPGFLGKGGWLAANAPSNGLVAFVCALAPGLVEAPRLDVHFWWNLGEVGLLLPAADASMRRRNWPVS
jgi:hypothetical protein